MRKSSIALTLILWLAGCFGDSAEDYLAAARKEMEKGNHEAAVVQLKNALQKSPSSGEARFLLGKTLLGLGDVAGASIELGKASDAGWQSDLLIPVQAEVSLAMSGPDKVVKQYAATELPDKLLSAELKATLATAYAMKGDFHAAREAVRAALEAAPGSVRAKLIAARIAAVLEGPAAALQALQPVLDSTAGTADAGKAWQLRGELLQISGDKQAEALAAFREALKADPKNLEVHALIVRRLLAEKQLEEAEKQLTLMRAARPKHPLWRQLAASLALDKGDLKSALEHTQALLKLAPDDGRVQYLAGLVALRQGELRQAESYLSKAVSALPGDFGVRLFLAQVFLRAGEAEKATSTLKTVLEGQPAATPAAAYALMGEAKLQLGELAEAEEYFKKAVKLNPNDVRSRTVLAVSQFEKGRAAQGAEELRAISTTDAGVVADLALINASLRNGDVDSALAAIATVEKKQPKLPLASLLRGKVNILRNLPTDAREAFGKAAAIDPRYFPAIAALASMDVVEGKGADARQRLEQFLKANPGHLNAALALTNVMAKMGASQDEQSNILRMAIKANPVEASPRLALIALQIDRGQFKQAVDIAQEGVSAMPDNSEMQEAFAQSLYRAGELNQALAEYNKVLSVQPASPRALVSMAEIYLFQKDYRSAGGALRKALAVRPDYLPAQRGLVILEAAMGRSPEALKAARAMQQGRDDNVGYLIEGDFQVSRKNWVAAIDAYRAGLEKRPSSLLAVKLHQAMLAAGKSLDARKMEQEWLHQHPKDVAFLYHLGERSMEMQQYPDALSYFESVRQLLPDDGPTLNNVAWLMHRLKKDGALDIALKATRIGPKIPNFLDTLAEIYADGGQLAKALETQKAAVALDPEIHAHRLHLAHYYLRSGEKSKAKDELSKLLAVGDRFVGQGEVKSLLANL